MRRAIFTGLILANVLFLFFLACTRRAEDVHDGRLLVMVSILPYADFVEKVGGDRVEVRVLIPPGASPATYEPTPRQIADLESARLYVKVGAHLPFEQAWLDKILAADSDILVVDASEGITLKGRDPHIWLSARLAKEQVRNISRGLISMDKSNTDFYERNTEAFLSELDALDVDIREDLKGLVDRRFMVFHPSFGYFAEDYDLEQIPVEVEGKEPGPKDLARLIDEAKTKKVNVIFAEPQFSSKSAQVISKSIGGAVVMIDPLARDYVDNLRRVAKSLKEGMEGR